MSTVSPRVHHCPRCGAPLSVPDGALSLQCSYCQVEVKLADARYYPPGAPYDPRVNAPVVYGHVPAEPFLPAKVRKTIGQGFFLLGALLFGLITVPVLPLLTHDRSSVATPIWTSIAAAFLGFLVFATGRYILGPVLPMLVGLVLFLKPFVRPVQHETGPFSLTSETHLMYLLPGAGLIFVFALLLIVGIILVQKKKGADDSVVFRAIAGGVFAVGIGLSVLSFGGPTVGEVIAQYHNRGLETREAWKKMADRLPKPGAFEPVEKKLSPAPHWDQHLSTGNDIEIFSAAELTNPDADPPYLDLILSGGLLRAVQWTGPKNPMSRTVLDESAGAMAKELEDAFATRWIAVYRPRGGTLSKYGGSDPLEIFVFDAKTLELVTSTTTESVSDWESGRQATLKALTRATGGVFQER